MDWKRTDKGWEADSQAGQLTIREWLIGSWTRFTLALDGWQVATRDSLEEIQNFAKEYGRTQKLSDLIKD